MPDSRSRPPLDPHPDRDSDRAARAPRDWTAAFAALPLETPPGDGWPRLATRLAGPRRRVRRWPLPLAAAASVLLAAVALWHGRPAVAPAPEVARAVDHGAGAAEADRRALAQLRAESVWLERLRDRLDDGAAASGVAAAMSLELDARVAGIDAALRQPSLSSGQQAALWQARVRALRTAVGFSGTDRWLAAQGVRYDAALVRVD